MFKIKTLFFGIFLLFSFMVCAADEPIGTVIGLSGKASVINSAGTTPLALKDTLMESDKVATASKSKVQILLRDGSAITLGEDTELELQEFSDIGTSPNFTADFVKGSLRVITGKITEANPEGFKITTPHSTLGIRGTILSLRTDESGTTLMVLNSDKIVLFNSAAVSENQRAVAWQGGTPVITPITSQEKEAEIREMMIVDEGSIQPEFIAKSALDIPIQHTVAAATFTGNVGEAGDIRGSFSFDVNIHTGAIGNAQTNGKTAGDIAWNLKNGGGEFRADGFNVRNFEGDIMYAPSSSPNPPSNLGMDADNTYLNGIPNGSGITGEFQLKLGTIYPFLSSDEIQMPISGGM